jgi:hypothetical protein
MMRVVVLIVAAFTLAGCLTDQREEPKPVITTAPAPQFPASAFTCRVSPQAPNPDSVGNRGGSAAAHYENGLVGVADDCRRKLRSIGAQLRAAGQVVDPAAGE